MSKRQHKKSYKERIHGKQKDFLKRAYNNREFKLDYDAENVEIPCACNLKTSYNIDEEKSNSNLGSRDLIGTTVQISTVLTK